MHMRISRRASFRVSAAVRLVRCRLQQARAFTKRPAPRLVVVVLLAGVAGCDNSASVGVLAPSGSPTGPPPEPTPNVVETFAIANVVLSGVVYEMTPAGRVPIEGVRVVTDHRHMFPMADAVTDARGVFSFRPVWVCPCSWAPWVEAGITSLWVHKPGYQRPAGQPLSSFERHAVVKDEHLWDVNVVGDTRLAIELVRR